MKYNLKMHEENNLFYMKGFGCLLQALATKTCDINFAVDVILFMIFCESDYRGLKEYQVP